MASYRDYEFLHDSFEGWILRGWGLTLVRNISSQELLRALGASTRPESVSGCVEVHQAWRPQGSDFFIGVADISAGWTLVVESGVAYMGVTASAISPVAVEHDLVAIHSNSFAWWVDGIELVSLADVARPDYDSPWGGAEPRRFEPLWASVVPSDVQTLGERDLEWIIPQALFAVVENITGVVLSEDMLASAQFVLATVPAPLPAVASSYTDSLRRAGWDARRLN